MSKWKKKFSQDSWASSCLPLYSAPFSSPVLMLHTVHCVRKIKKPNILRPIVAASSKYYRCALVLDLCSHAPHTLFSEPLSGAPGHRSPSGRGCQISQQLSLDGFPWDIYFEIPSSYGKIPRMFWDHFALVP